MNSFTRRVLFFLFFLSGFASLVYPVVLTRMAVSGFGIITPVLSVVLSVFMLGLAIGSWAGGRWIPVLTKRTGFSAAFFYAGWELVIGVGAFAVPKLFAVGEQLLLASGETDSFRYLALSALVLAASILPWCVCMGATFPFMMAYILERDGRNTESFSFLYLANVLGAMSGTLLAAVVWIELLGFHHTLWLAAAGNFAIAFISGCLGWEQQSAGKTDAAAPVANAAVAEARPVGTPDEMIKWVLFFRVCGDGDGGGVDAGIHAGAENAGVFVRDDCVRVFGRDVSGFVDVSAGFAGAPAEADGHFAGGAGGAGLFPGAGEQSENRGGGLLETGHPFVERAPAAGKHCTVLRAAGLPDAGFD